MENIPPHEDDSPQSTDQMEWPRLIGKSVFGGILMGLANLVPGISGGTMLLAAGVYPRLIGAIAGLTKLQFKVESIILLGTIVVSAAIAILIGAGPIKELVVHQRWGMYSLFIGLTLGGVPLVWNLARPVQPMLFVSGFIALAAMVMLAILQSKNFTSSIPNNFLMSLVAGLSGASAMILPGLSGGYILLLLGQYVPVLSAIDQFKDSLKAGDLSAAMDPAISVLLPVGIGVVVGVVLVGNLIEWTLKKYRQATLGMLLGLLIGSVASLWPFQQGVKPELGQTIKGAVVNEQNISDIDEEDWLLDYFAPTTPQVLCSVALMAVGFAVTIGVSKLGGNEEE